MVCLIDSDVFIRASNLHYSFDFCPAFWDWLKQMNITEKVYSVSAVFAELQPGADYLAAWSKSRASQFFIDPDPDTLSQYSSIQNWLRSSNYEAGAINEFFQAADSALLASAMSKQWTVVTHETPANTRKKVKIPNACVGLKVKCINPYAMLRQEQAKFVLGRQ